MDELKLRLIQQLISCKDVKRLHAVAQVLDPDAESTLGDDFGPAIRGLLGESPTPEALQRLQREIDDFFGP